MFFAPRKLGAHLNRETGNVSFDRQLAAYIRGLESTTRPRRHQTTAGTHDDPDYRPVQLFNDQTPSIAWARKLPPMLHLETRGRAMRRSAPFPRIRSRARPTGVIPRARAKSRLSGKAAYAGGLRRRLSRPITGAADVRSFFGATRAMFDAIAFKHEVTVGSRT